MNKIIQACIKKDRSGYKQLYDLYSSKMLTICRIYARNDVDAKDIFQTGFIRVFENISQLKDEKALEAWMKRIFINESILFYKKNARFLVDEAKIPENASENDIGEEIDGQLVLKAIQELPLRMRQVFGMYVIEGYNHKEISEQLGISEGTSKSTLHDARNVLKKRITDLYNDSSSPDER
jgi:RNA polymerase sigma factor (sigma-70 family)